MNASLAAAAVFSIPLILFLIIGLYVDDQKDDEKQDKLKKQAKPS